MFVSDWFGWIWLTMSKLTVCVIMMSIELINDCPLFKGCLSSFTHWNVQWVQWFFRVELLLKYLMIERLIHAEDVF